MFYSYLWLRENGNPFYAGKGSRRRAFVSHQRLKPPPLSGVVLFPMESEALAFESEKALIELFGREDLGTGCLLNLTEGGDQPPSRKGLKPNITDAMRAKCAEAAARGWTAERKAAHRARRLGHPTSAFCRRRSSEVHKGNKYRLGSKASPETIARKSAALKGKPWSAARRAAHERRYGNGD